MSRYEDWLNKFIGKTLTRDPEYLDKESADVEYASWDNTLYVNSNYRDDRHNEGLSVSTGMEITLKDSVITKIQITARMYGDDGLGDVWPEDVWNMSDYREAKAFLKYITE